MSELPPDAENALRSFAPSEHDVPSMDRVRARAMRSVRRRRAARRAGALASVAAVAMLAVWIALPTPTSAPSVANVTNARGASMAGEVIASGAGVPAGPIAIDEGGALDLHLGSAQASFEGPGSGRIDQGRLTLDEGRASISGELAVAGCGCDAKVDGEVELESFAHHLRIVIVAGHVETETPVYCRIIELEEPAAEPEVEPESADEAEPEIEAAAVERQARPARRAERCDLGEQAEAYRQATRLRGQSDAQLIRELRSIQRRWPRCPLSHEVDVALIETLLRVGNERAAKREARRFLRRYPRSPRRSELQSLTQ